MKLLFQKQMIKFEQVPSVEEVIENINKFLDDKYYFSHLVADGEEVLDDPEQFLAKYVVDIGTLEIIAIAAEEFINGLFLSSEEYTARATSHITELSDDFYANPSGANWIELSEMLEGIQWLLTMIETVDKSIVRPSNWSEVMAPAVGLQGELENLEEALENTDTVLIADMLHYEVLPVFEIFAVEIKKIIDTVGTRYDFS